MEKLYSLASTIRTTERDKAAGLQINGSFSFLFCCVLTVFKASLLFTSYITFFVCYSTFENRLLGPTVQHHRRRHHDNL